MKSLTSAALRILLWLSAANATEGRENAFEFWDNGSCDRTIVDFP
jgi:hypothetical protein